MRKDKLNMKNCDGYYITGKANIFYYSGFTSEFAITVGLPPSITATHEFVVPKSIPIILLIILSIPFFYISLICYFNHTVADYTIVFISVTLHKFFNNGVVINLFIINMHYRIVKIRVKFFTDSSNFRNFKLV